uniref:D-isomer specific 2-hydroxyacid dehydrogenase NAD-binding domain-containing protein n=1 Tax=Lotharella globosa TaxID=91324 RepID=A0A6U3BTH1_9EUKA|mmetsp:Transcript_7701/g.15025  ORF Transcript_7701/g.15025 Transcript_7701/m.15025 type:complete len:312 (-) Transcript_7701:405-1340(-)|eukprot:CAMPEP_0167787568 /NCGR_PEP_ID=MMETSP0111_2-20121227/9510_1 /TAXON_ID=91324 /ORGANISM="Lotharella globosa, Strain CCCM811" /LENGTH=311 /DNA_ID=CAMNT_0007679255 /DNA_START=43 /DNA_END=978 /DNA_ORIENTATION=+
MSLNAVITQGLGVPKETVEALAKERGITVHWQEDAAEPKPANPDALIMVNKKTTGEFLGKLKPKMVAVAFTGYDAVDMKFCKENKIAVYNVPAYSSDSVAELAVGLALAVYREIPIADKAIREGKWVISAGGTELKGKTIGILGTGTIGIATAKLFKAFGCKLIGWSRSEKKEFTDIGGTYVKTKEDLFAGADVVSLHVPCNAHTMGCVGEAELSKLKSSSVLINVGRGGLVQQEVLAKMLHEKKFRAGLDVFKQEPVDPKDPILTAPNCVLTPHVAYKTTEALARRVIVTLDNIVSFSKSSDVNRVDTKA